MIVKGIPSLSCGIALFILFSIDATIAARMVNKASKRRSRFPELAAAGI
jgi:hypothetical protein